MRYTQIKRDEAETNIRTEKAREAERVAYDKELEVACLERAAKLQDHPYAAIATRTLPYRQQVAKVARARADLRAVRAGLGDEERREVQAAVLDQNLAFWEQEHLRTTVELEELLDIEDPDELVTEQTPRGEVTASVSEWIQAKRDKIKDLDARHALGKELRAPLRGNRAQRRAAATKAKRAAAK